MKNVYLFQPQYSLEIRKELNYWIPYSAGCLWSYANQFDEISQNYTLQDIIFKREPHDQLLDQIQNPTVCGFSTYLWNKTYNLALAKKIKTRWPDCVIIFGGPEINVTYELYEFIDHIVLAEGEEAFKQILCDIQAGAQSPKVFPKQRVKDLDIPSPYTTGVFDKLVADHPDVKWATVLETNRGCPFNCTFCDWGGTTYAKVYKFGLQRVVQDLEWISNHPISYIFCSDANFGIFKDRDLEIAKLVAETARKNPCIETFNATFNKNNNEWSFEILNILGDLNRGFTVSVQSMNPATLKAIKRENLGINDLNHIFKLCQEKNINSYTELILGLPLETKQSFVHGICELLELGQHNQVEIWFANMLANSEMSSPNYRLNFGIKTVKTPQYLALFNNDGPDGYDDEVELVSATKTMTTQDLVDSFLWAWMINNFHMLGFTQVVSRWCRSIHNIGYKNFYDAFYKQAMRHDKIKNLFDYVKVTATNLLTTGSMPPNVSAHNLMSLRGKDIYAHRQTIWEILEQVLTKFNIKDTLAVMTLQKAFVYDIEQEYPFNISVNIDLQTFVPKQQSYVVTPSHPRALEMKNNHNMDDVYYILRRHKALKTSMVQI